MMNLLIVYEVSPESVFTFVLEASDPRVELFKQAHGLLVNFNDKDYPAEVVELVSNISEELQEIPKIPLQISGDFTVIHCGFVL
jgi:hypothetical protein